jgi:hypothetical protein
MPRPGRITVNYGAPLFYERQETLEKFAGRLQKQVQELGRARDRTSGTVT